MTPPLRSFLLHGSTIALLALAGLTQAAGKHALTLYDEPAKYPANYQHFDYVNPDAPKGGTFRQAGFGGFDSLNPFINKGVAADDIGMIYDTLTRHGLDEPFSEYGLLAEKIEKAPDNSWVRFYLRPEARFNDGQAVTAEDVKFTFETLMTHGAPTYRAYYADVERVEVEGPRRVRFIFKHAGNRELPLILGQLPVLPKHWWAERDFSKGNLEIPLGSGPYKVAEVKAGRSIRYERVKDWWGKDLPVNRGFYNFDTMQLDYYRDNTVALEALKAGQFDYWLETSAKNWATAYDSPAVANGQLIKEEIDNQNPTGMQGFVFNTRRPLFQDKRVREALGLLFDFEWTNRQLFNGAYTRTRSYFDNSELASSGLPETDELKLLEPLRDKIPPAVFTDEFRVPVTDGSGIIREQQRRAYQLLQEAGWRIEGDQMLDAEGKPVSFEFLLAQTEFERVLLPFKRNMADLGMELVIRRVDVSQYINRLRSRDFDLIVGGFGQSNSPGNEQREYWHSSSADNPGSRNFIGLKDPAIDQLVEGLINANSRQSLVAHTRALDRVLLWGHYVIPNWHIKTWRVAYWNRFEHPKVTPKYDIGLNTWWARPQQEPATTDNAAAASTEQ
ncbi:MAG: extracellular solute-binding protein [Pseudomonas sp.]|uniref:extracellular solute-binding protein n=1 Tax=Pseudomonas sp. TaxID=306 RepID=UPI003BB6EB34